MDSAIQKAGISYTDEQINQLAQRHFENIQVHIYITKLGSMRVYYNLFFSFINSFLDVIF